MSEPFIDFLNTRSHRVNYETRFKKCTRYNFNKCFSYAACLSHSTLYPPHILPTVSSSYTVSIPLPYFFPYHYLNTCLNLILDQPPVVVFHMCCSQYRYRYHNICPPYATSIYVDFCFTFQIPPLTPPCCLGSPFFLITT